MDKILLDTGPLIALLCPQDNHHADCLAWYKERKAIFLTTEAVLTEAAYLLRRFFPNGPSVCLEFFIRGGAALIPLQLKTLIRLKGLMEKYQDIPMDFADATLVALGDDMGVSKIFTLDKRGFVSYRMESGKSFEIFPTY